MKQVIARIGKRLYTEYSVVRIGIEMEERRGGGRGERELEKHRR